MENVHFIRTLEDLTTAIRFGRTNVILVKPLHAGHDEKTCIRNLILQLKAIKHGVLDNDGTLIHDRQWVAVAKYLSSELQEEERIDRDWYYSIKDDGDEDVLSINDPEWFTSHVLKDNRSAVEGAWLARTLERYRRSGITRDQVVEAGRSLELREGVPELFDLLDAKAVITFGIEQTVKGCLDHNGLSASIAATRFLFDDSGVITGYHPNIVVSTTKKPAVERFQNLGGFSDESIIAIGDSVVDIDMMPAGAVNVLILPPGEADKKLAAFRENHLAAMWDKLSMVIINDSFMPLVDLIKWARKKSVPETKTRPD